MDDEEHLLTAEERAKLGAAVGEANRFRLTLLVRRHGRPLEPAWQAIDRTREERSRDRA